MEKFRCAWCGKIEKYNGCKDPSNEYLCGSCVQIFLKFSQDELKEAFRLAISKGNSDKAAILKIFIKSQEQEELIGKRPERFERCNDRNRTDRVSRR